MTKMNPRANPFSKTKSIQLDDFVTLRARPVQSCPKPSVVLGYETPFPKSEMLSVCRATRYIRQLLPTITLPASGIERRKITYIKLNIQIQRPPPMCFSLIPNLKVFGMDATA
jgi:hypothetical protein